MKCENQTAINIAKNSIQHGKIKRIEIDRCFIEEKIKQKIVQVSCSKKKVLCSY